MNGYTAAAIPHKAMAPKRHSLRTARSTRRRARATETAAVSLSAANEAEGSLPAQIGRDESTIATADERHNTIAVCVGGDGRGGERGCER